MELSWAQWVYSTGTMVGRMQVPWNITSASLYFHIRMLPGMEGAGRRVRARNILLQSSINWSAWWNVRCESNTEPHCLVSLFSVRWPGPAQSKWNCDTGKAQPDMADFCVCDFTLQTHFISKGHVSVFILGKTLRETSLLFQQIHSFPAERSNSQRG